MYVCYNTKLLIKLRGGGVIMVEREDKIYSRIGIYGIRNKVNNKINVTPQCINDICNYKRWKNI
mgnify:FL=1